MASNSQTAENDVFALRSSAGSNSLKGEAAWHRILRWQNTRGCALRSCVGLISLKGEAGWDRILGLQNIGICSGGVEASRDGEMDGPRDGGI